MTTFIWRVGQSSARAGRAADAPSAETNVRRSMVILPDRLLPEAFHVPHVEVQR
jgi:hypothetical protein